jgi:protocatechuate 3,4-dioxygenase beta subunit
MFRAVIPCLLAAAIAAAQPQPQVQVQAAPAQPPAPATASIEGQVFNLATGAPLKRASVRLVGLGRRQQQPGGMPQMLSRETDEQGKFSFTSLEAGRYQLSAERQGFLRQSYGGRKYNTSGTPLPLAADQHVKDIVFKLSPQSVVTGKVLDEDGEPMANVQVRALKYAYRGGKKQWVQAGNANTSDIGEYRIPNLEPGRYLISTTQRQMGGGNFQTPSNEPLPETPEMNYAPTYYPSTSDEASAAPVEVGPGGEIRGIDIRPVRTRVFRVRGRVAVAEGGRGNPNIMLMSKDGSRTVPNMSPVRPPENRFELRGVPAGSYIVYAQMGGRAMAYQPIEVRGNHVDNLVLNMTNGGDVTGTVKVVDATAPIDLPNVSLMLRADAQFAGPPRGKVQDGVTTIKNVLPMHYTVMVTGVPETCFVKSIRYGGQEMPESGIDIAPGGSIEVTLSATAGTISGAVVDKDGKPVPGATVALAAKDGPPNSIKGNTTDENGAFSFSGLKPGDYRLYGWEDIPPGAYADPDFLKQYEGRAQTVKLDPSAKQAVQLKVIPAE